MSNVNIFEQASRLNLVFPSKRGTLRVDDLWNIPIMELNEIGSVVHSKLKTESFSLIEEKSSENTTLNLMLELLTYIAKTRQKEKDEAAQKQLAAGQKQFLLDLLEKKRAAGLAELSEEELLKRIEDLG